MAGLKDDRRQMFRQWLVGTHLAWTPVAAIALCGSIGYWADLKTGRSPTFLITGLLLGVAVALYELFRGVAWLDKMNSRKRGKER
jgi:F0F1-type ATP synthase assembly protein I